MTKAQIRAWLLRYAWNGTPAQREAEVDCIMSQDGWQHLEAKAEKYRGMAEDENTATEAEGFALSALYECHEGPHLRTCPGFRVKAA